MNDRDIMKEVLFDLSEDALYVANGGHTFTREGVIGICASYLSEKRDIQSDHYQCNDKDLVSQIGEGEIELYKTKAGKNRIKEDASQERETSHDYDGRFAWELLQNADDVMGSSGRQPAELIGTKGLGFKSVLKITEEPEIHSGPFNFKFSPEKTQKLLMDRNIEVDPPRLTFRIPHVCEPAGKSLDLLDMGYSTVVRLPFREKDAQEKTKKVLKNLDPCFLLLSQQIETVRIIQDGVEQVFRIRRGTQGLSEGRVVLVTPSGKTEWQRWTITQDIDETKRITVAIAIPLNGNGEAVPHTDELPFHVFFPTEEQLGVKALLHASFDLDQSRNHLRQGNHDEVILDHFGDLFKRVILDIPPQTVLKVFGDIDRPKEDDGKPIEKIKKTIWEKMRTTAFLPVLGGERVSPPDSRCWKDKLGHVLREDEKEIQKAALVTPALSDFSSDLKELGASEIEDSQFVHLLRYCRNESLDDCISSFHVLLEGGLDRVQKDNDKETLNLLRQIPCWWIEDGEARHLDDFPPLLWEKPDKWPNWLKAKTLHRDLRVKIEEWEKEQKAASDLSPNPELNKWECLIDGHLSRKNEHYIDWVLIPFIKDWEQQDWEKHSFATLKWLMHWENPHNFNEIAPWIRDKEGRRNTLAASIRLPTDKGWLPAMDCFVGKDWDGPGAFDTFYQDRIDRGMVQSFENWCGELQETDKDKWKGLLRWIGVSWEPKVHLTPDFTIADHQLWSSYESKHNNVTLQGGHNYLIDDFPNCLSSIGNAKLLRDIFPALSKLIGEHAQRNWRYPTGKVEYSSSPKAFAFEQLSKAGWLPVKKSLLENDTRLPPYRTFLPGKGLNDLLPEVDRTGIDDDTWHGKDGTKAKLSELGVMENLPEDAQKWHEWMRKLAEKGRTLKQEYREAPVDWKDCEAIAAKHLWRAARSLYREYLRKGVFGLFPEDIQIPCVRFANNHRLIDFAKPQEVHCIDEAHLADVTLENKLLSQGYKLFIFRLKEVDNARQLGIKELSSVIKCKPDYHNLVNDDVEKELVQRYKDRRIVLNTVMDIQLPKPEEVSIKAVTDLTLKLSTSGQELGNCPVLSWREGETGHILVDTENKWRALAHALAHRLDRQDSKYINDFEVYLSDDNDVSVLARARDAGIPEEALQEVKNNFSSLTKSPVQNEEVAGEATEDMGNESTTQSSEPDDATGQTTVSGNSANTENRIISDSRDKPKKARERLTNDDGRKGDPRPETGLVAEKWLEERLLKIWPQQVENVHEGKDFTISLDEQKIHIEAKHIKTPPGSIHWSDKQYLTSQREMPRYFIALLTPEESGNNQYTIYWIWNPLEELKDLERYVTWSGESKPKLLQKGGWAIEDLKRDLLNLEPDTYTIKVELTDDLFSPDNRDELTLEKLKHKIENSA